MRLFASAALLLAASFPLFGQTPVKRSMTFADLAGMKRVSDPQVSPSGKWVLFSVTDVVLEKNSKTNHLWVVPLKEGAGAAPRAQGPGSSERQVTSGAGESNGRFSPDGKLVMYSANDDKGRGEIFVAPWDDAAGRMGAGRAVTSVETEADGAIWAPDSQHFLFVSSVYPECESHAAAGMQRNAEEQHCNELKDAVAASSPVQARVFDHLLYRHWNQFVGPKHSHIFYAGLDGAAPADLTPASVVGDHEAPTFSLGGPLGYAISPDGKEVAYSVNLDKVPAESTNNDIFVLQVGAEPQTARKVSTSPGSDDGPQYSPDGKWLAWRSQARGGFESDRYRLVALNRSSGSIWDLSTVYRDQSGKVTQDNSVDEFAWDRQSSFLLFTTPDRGEEAIHTVELQSHVEGSGTFETRLLATDAEFSDVRLAPDGLNVIATRMTVQDPASIVRISHTVQPERGYDVVVSNTHIDTLSSRNVSALSSLDLPKMERFWFPGAAKDQVQGFLIRPPNFDPAKKYPLKFLIHGGPQGAWGDAWSYRWNPELLAANGYVVVMVNPRGSTGYGQQFTDEVSGDWGGRAYVDLMKGLDYAEAKYPFIDKTRECALGASYGGYMANWVLTHTDRFKCIVTHDGMYNPQSAFGTTEEMWFNEWEFRGMGGARAQGSGSSKDGHAVVEQTKPAHPWDFYDKPASKDPFRKWSPMLAIKNAHTPTLVIHGQRDYRLDVSEGFQLFTALQLLGVPSKMLYFPDEGHWVMKPKNSELWYETVNDWCDRWTGTNAYAGKGPERNPASVAGRAQDSGLRAQKASRSPSGPGAGVQTQGTNAKVDK